MSAQPAESASHGILTSDSIPDPSDLEKELLLAAAAGDVPYIARLLQYDFDYNAVDSDGATACALATKSGSTEAVLALLQKGVNPNTADSSGNAPIHIACKANNTVLVKELVRHKAALNNAVPFVGTPALIACKSQSLSTLKILLDAKANPNILTQGEGLLSVCAELDSLPMLEAVVAAKPDFEVVDSNGYTSLMIASQKGLTEIVRVLLSCKADATHISPEGSTAIYLADFMGHADVVSLLEQFGAGVTDAELLKLHKLVEKDDLRSVHLVVRNGADINAGRKQDGMNALMLAAHRGYADIVEYLLDKSQLDLSVRNHKGQSPLHACCLNRNAESFDKSASIARMLISKANELAKIKADEEKKAEEKQSESKKQANKNERKKTSNGVYGSTKEKKQSGPEQGHIDEWDSNGRTALHYAVTCDNMPAVLELLDAKASIASKDKVGHSMLHLATRSGSIKLVEFLLENKADVKAVDNDKHTPLHVACQHRTLPFIKALVEANSDLNAKLKDGTTPLYLTCCYGDIEATDYLVMKGADHSICDDFGDYDPFKSLKTKNKKSKKSQRSGK